ncbi:MAG: phage capsid protein [Oscillospiraceae bacterium]|nr:phage capsid protein [Oscillospiraceae bacterium]
MITLAEAKVGMSDKVDQMVVDEFRRGSWLLDNLIFDNAISPGTGGSTLAYGYVKLKTPSTAAFRALNTEYANNEAIREELSAYCKPFGGSFKLDRVIIKTAGTVDELNFQLREKIKGAVNLFHYTVINGDRALRPDEFDGLDVFLTGSSTEYNAGGTAFDISSSTLLDSEYNRFLDMMDEFVSGLDDTPTAFLANTVLANKVKGVARRAGYYTRMEDAFGRAVDAWNNIPILDMRQYWNGTASVPTIPIDATSGTTSLFAATISEDGFHGISPTGSNVIQTALPDPNAPGVLKEGDVELVAGVVLKNSLKAGAFRNIKVR